MWLFLLVFKKASLFNRSLFLHTLICIISTFLLLNITDTTILIYYICVEFLHNYICVEFITFEEYNNDNVFNSGQLSSLNMDFGFFGSTDD